MKGLNSELIKRSTQSAQKFREDELKNINALYNYCVFNEKEEATSYELFINNINTGNNLGLMEPSENEGKKEMIEAAKVEHKELLQTIKELFYMGIYVGFLVVTESIINPDPMVVKAVVEASQKDIITRINARITKGKINQLNEIYLKIYFSLGRQLGDTCSCLFKHIIFLEKTGETGVRFTDVRRLFIELDGLFNFILRRNSSFISIASIFSFNR